MRKSEGFPDFFVVGAPRCGTTALCRYLARNPEICFSRPKEPHYFVQTDRLPTDLELKRDYIDRYFSHRTAENRLSGEGSVSYISLPEPLKRIRQLNPKAKFIAVVRNPLTLLPSYHQRMLFLLQEDEADFDRAWALQSVRARGERIPDTCLNPFLLMYSLGASLGAGIKQLFSIAGREYCHVVVFDDFKDDTRAAYCGILDFLGVADDGQTEFERRYESQVYRSRWLQRLFFISATRGTKSLDSIKRRKRKYREDGSKKRDLIKLITDLNKKVQRSNPLSPQMAATIREQMRDDNRLLSQLLNRDLGFWLDADHSATPAQTSD